jgi:hypothetical protein
MNFTFGIITAGGAENNLHSIIDSIEALGIPKYEVIIIGNANIERHHTTVIPFDETIKPMWITRKKNLVTAHAHYENIVYLHDYVAFSKDWYEGFLKFGDDFKVCMTKIVNPDQSRFRDWVLWPHNNHSIDKIVEKNKQCLLPYDVTSLSRYMYISGTYWVAKKHLMLEYPLNETLSWGEGEDVEWSKQVRQKHVFSMNPFSTVCFLKTKDPIFKVMDEETLFILKAINAPWYHFALERTLLIRWLPKVQTYLYLKMPS